jgi:hypothetical protein
MSLEIDFDMAPNEREVRLTIAPTSRFTRESFRSVALLLHPQANVLDQNREVECSLLQNWVRIHVKGELALMRCCRLVLKSRQIPLSCVLAVSRLETADSLVHSL